MYIEEVTNISINNTNDVEAVDLQPFDFSKLNAISACPFYGIVRHVLNKNFQTNERSMALECGALCHQCFACYRALSIWSRGIEENKERLVIMAKNYLINLFLEVIPDITVEQANDFINNCKNEADQCTTKLAKYTIFSNFLIDNSTYYEDPDDKKRTVVNIKDSLLQYCSQFLDLVQDEPVWIEDENNIESKIGIEIGFDTVICIKYIANGYENEQKIRFIGKVDGIHYRKQDGSLIIHENKTTSRIDESWVGQWYKSHQITGYCIFAQFFTGKDCNQARVLGMQIPQPKYSGVGYRTERVDRDWSYFEDWARWVLTTYNIVEEYKNDPVVAPMNTHNCCKFYRQCNFLPLCVQSKEQRAETINNEMIIDEWNPLDE